MGLVTLDAAVATLALVATTPVDGVGFATAATATSTNPLAVVASAT